MDVYVVRNRILVSKKHKENGLLRILYWMPIPLETHLPGSIRMFRRKIEIDLSFWILEVAQLERTPNACGTEQISW